MNKFLRLKLVIEITGLSRSSIYSQIKQGIFPKNISLGPRSVAWLESDIQDWIDARIHQNEWH
jgi:prophage regulatory protein